MAVSEYSYATDEGERVIVRVLIDLVSVLVLLIVVV